MLDYRKAWTAEKLDIVMQEVSNLVAVNEPAIIEPEKQEEELQTELNNGDTNAD